MSFREELRSGEASWLLALCLAYMGFNKHLGNSWMDGWMDGQKDPLPYKGKK